MTDNLFFLSHSTSSHEVSKVGPPLRRSTRGLVTWLGKRESSKLKMSHAQHQLYRALIIIHISCSLWLVLARSSFPLPRHWSTCSPDGEIKYPCTPTVLRQKERNVEKTYVTFISLDWPFAEGNVRSAIGPRTFRPLLRFAEVSRNRAESIYPRHRSLYFFIPHSQCPSSIFVLYLFAMEPFSTVDDDKPPEPLRQQRRNL